MIPYFPKFKPLELCDKFEVEKFTSKFPPYNDFSFTNLWAWDIHNKTMISDLNNNLVILFHDYITNKPFFSFIGENLIENTALSIIEYSEKEYNVPYLKLIPEHIINHFQNNNWIVVSDKDSDDYILSVAFLKEMDKLTKNNLAKAIKYFVKTYSNYSIEYDSLNDIENKLYFELIDDWNNLSGLCINERMALKKYFELEQSEIKIHSLFIDNKLIAFNTCEFSEKDYAISHFSKANKAYKGAYEFLCMEEAKYLSNQGIKFLNIEQDLGIEGLRFAKQKFRPSHFLKKYILKRKY